MPNLDAREGIAGTLILLMTGGAGTAVVNAFREWRKERMARSSPAERQRETDASVVTMGRVQDELEAENGRLRDERDQLQKRLYAAEDRRVRDVQAAEDRARNLEVQLREEMRSLRDYADGLEVRVRALLEEVLDLKQRVRPHPAGMNTGVPAADPPNEEEL